MRVSVPHAINGLERCGEMSMSAMPMVVALLDDPENSCRSSALTYLCVSSRPKPLSRIASPYSKQPMMLTKQSDCWQREFFRRSDPFTKSSFLSG
jgi:hypothetical protein